MENKYEKRERRFIDWYINQNPQHKLEEVTPEGSMERNDFIMYSGRTLVMGEVKIREIEIDKYNTSIIETSKVLGLMEKFLSTKKLDTNAKLIFIAVYPKSKKYIVIDLMNQSSTLSFEYCDKTTFKTSNKIDKACNNYKITESTIYDIK